MKIFLLLPTLAAALAAQVRPDTVVASVSGIKFTAGEIEAYLRIAPPQARQNYQRDPQGYLRQLALMMRFTAMAVENKLDQQSPYKEQIEFNRMVALFNATVSHQQMQIVVSEEDRKKHYQANQPRYTQLRTKVVYIAFNASKGVTEAAAKAKAEKLHANLRAGADFAALAKQHSDDAGSASKNGDFGLMKRSDAQVPESIRTALFALKAGELSAPLRAPNGYYLFRVEQVLVQPYDEVKDPIHTEIQQARFTQWMDAQHKSLEVKIENPAYFTAKPDLR
ncbi:MAG: peptidylprolyl isomerase [Bryobacteraceae bacterium]